MLGKVKYVCRSEHIIQVLLEIYIAYKYICMYVRNFGDVLVLHIPAIKYIFEIHK